MLGVTWSCQWKWLPAEITRTRAEWMDRLKVALALCFCLLLPIYIVWWWQELDPWCSSQLSSLCSMSTWHAKPLCPLIGHPLTGQPSGLQYPPVPSKGSSFQHACPLLLHVHMTLGQSRKHKTLNADFVFLSLWVSGKKLEWSNLLLWVWC